MSLKILNLFTGGGYSLVDDEDYRAWRGFRWGSDRGYICADFRLKGRRPKRFFLHRLIAKPQPWQQVHHKNRCRWDNRRENLECLSIEDHLKRHPNSKRLQSLAAAQRLARQQWIAEQQFLERIRQVEREDGQKSCS